MYRQLLIAGLVAGATLTAGGIAAVWTMEKSPAERHSDLGQKLKPIARGVQAAGWNEHGGAALAPLAVAPVAARPHPAPLAAAAAPMPTVLAVAATAAAQPPQPALPVATQGAAHCALSDNCTPALAGGNNAPHAGRPGAALARAGTLPLAAIGALAAQPSAAPVALTAPAPSLTMLLADTTPLGPATIGDPVENGHTGGPRDVPGRAQEVTGSLPPAAPGPAPASSGPFGVTPGGPGGTADGPPFATLAPTQTPGSPSAPSATVPSPILELGDGPQVVRQLDPTGQGPNAPLLEQVVSAAADSAVGEPPSNILLLVALLGAAVMVRRRVP